MIGLAGLSAGIHAQRVKSTPVLGAFRCVEPGGLAGCPTGDRVRGDSAIDPYAGQWPASANPLTFEIGSGRFLAVHPGRPEAGSTICNPCLAAALYDQVMWTDRAQLLIVVIDGSGNELVGGFSAIPVGESRFARGKINVWDPADDSALWVYRFNAVDYPGSSNLIVSRTSTTEWIVTTSAASSDRARLIYTRLQGKTFLNDEGLFSMPFALTVRK